MLDRELVSQPCSRVLVGEKARFPHGLRLRNGPYPFNRNNPFSIVVALIALVAIIPGKVEFTQLSLGPVHEKRALVVSLGFAGDGTNSYIPNLGNVGEDSGTNRQILERL
ncbi:hypothetical protein ARTSIC4J27_1999 [Pseudarthrobacter siccitolerans]|uniref:Uncharacterized protein n=1 Tax=Pseudarthrobacter siccitolerans TaxID=861266 RepID=A0A024H2Q8_9MICC|nr:hypothetical protein ARTSIC4J27_1999 [Pseudarthrobacter siccitolerans]